MQFEPGAPPSGAIIPLCVPEIRGNEWHYVKECLDTNWVSSAGSYVDRFERMVADYVGAKYAVAAVNGTAALHIALLAAGVQPDDEVLTSTLTFIAPTNAIRYCGAWPILIDAEPVYWQIDPQRVIDFLENRCRWQNNELYNRTTGRRVKAILPVHILGHPVDIDPILETARKYDLAVIEDAAESLGARYKDRMVGHLGDVGCFSFNGNKIITAGGGGMIVTDSEAWASKAKYLTTQAKDDPIEYIHNETGFNYRLTNIQAALGCAQMELLDVYVQQKRNTALNYVRLLEPVQGICPMPEAHWAFSTYWLFSIHIDKQLYGLDSRKLLKLLREAGIQGRPLWQPIHQSPSQGDMIHLASPVAEEINRTVLSLPSSVGITQSQIETVVAQIKNSAR